MNSVRRISVRPGSEIARLLDEARGEPVLLEKDGVTYSLSVVDDIWHGYDPRAVDQAIDKTAGSWADVDVDALVEGIYRAREEGSRPDNRP